MNNLNFIENLIHIKIYTFANSDIDFSTDSKENIILQALIKMFFLFNFLQFEMIGVCKHFADAIKESIRMRTTPFKIEKQYLKSPKS